VELAYDSLGNNKQAIADYNKAIELDPKDPTGWHGRGSANVNNNTNLDQAITDLSKAIELYTNDPTNLAGALEDRGVAYTRQQKYDLGIADLTKAIELTPKEGVFYYDRGDAYRQKGQKTQAIADLEKYLQLDPNTSARTKVEGWLSELKGQ